MHHVDHGIELVEEAGLVAERARIHRQEEMPDVIGLAGWRGPCVAVKAAPDKVLDRISTIIASP